MSESNIPIPVAEDNGQLSLACLPMADSGDDGLRSPTGTEHAILRKLLAVDFPGKADLVTQLTSLRVRTLDAEGSLALEASPSSPAARVMRRIPVEAELEDRDGVTVHVLLHVFNGFMNELEFYRDDSGPIKQAVDPEHLNVVVF